MKALLAVHIRMDVSFIFRYKTCNHLNAILEVLLRFTAQRVYNVFRIGLVSIAQALLENFALNVLRDFGLIVATLR